MCLRNTFQGYRIILTNFRQKEWGNCTPLPQPGIKKTPQGPTQIRVKVFQAKNEKWYPVYVAKQNSKREEQLIFVMIPNALS